MLGTTSGAELCNELFVMGNTLYNSTFSLTKLFICLFKIFVWLLSANHSQLVIYKSYTERLSPVSEDSIFLGNLLFASAL